MIVNTFQCDGCGGQKGSLNHWFRFRISPSWAKDKGEWFSILTWNAEPEDNDKHLCSDACVIKTVQGWLSAQKEASQKLGEVTQ